jgi:hypothetical protein
MERDQKIEEIRYSCQIETNNPNLGDHFLQTTVLPIMDLQESFIQMIFNVHLQERDIEIPLVEPFRQRLIIENLIEKNEALKNRLMGCILGLFTRQELEEYHKRIRSLEGKIVQMISRKIENNISIAV